MVIGRFYTNVSNSAHFDQHFNSFQHDFGEEYRHFPIFFSDHIDHIHSARKYNYSQKFSDAAQVILKNINK